jgi:hypothetical protein
VKQFAILGASNARRGLPAIVAAARHAAGEPVRIFGAIGHGRSYGAASSVLGRRLPGILQSGIWQALESAADESRDAVLMDIGNDLLYGFPVSGILGWVTDCVSRLKRLGGRITVAALPIDRIEKLDPVRFLLFRSIFFPSSRLSLPEVVDSAETLDEGLRRIAGEENLRFVAPRPRWYGLDPIHIRLRDSREAWSKIIGTANTARRLSRVETIRLRLARPERESFFGMERFHAQPVARWSDGSEVRLY